MEESTGGIPSLFLQNLQNIEHHNVKTNNNSPEMDILNRNWTLGLAAQKVLVPVC